MLMLTEYLTHITFVWNLKLIEQHWNYGTQNILRFNNWAYYLSCIEYFVLHNNLTLHPTELINWHHSLPKPKYNPQNKSSQIPQNPSQPPN